jgi:hypothetical protein
MLRRPGNRLQDVKLTINVLYAPHPNTTAKDSRLRDVTHGQRNGHNFRPDVRTPTVRTFGKRRKTGKCDSGEGQQELKGPV